MEWKPHVTVAAIITHEDKYLLVEEIIKNNHVINQPAGHLEDNESLLDAIKREVLEETCGFFIPESLVGIYHFKHEIENKVYLRFCFHGRCEDFDQQRKPDKEIIRILWLSREELESSLYKPRSPIVMKCINDFESGHSYPLNIISSSSL